ncbi:MAG: RNA polymerase sigma factor [Acidimicrobiia bacterium]
MNASATLEQIFRREYGLVLSSLVRTFGDLELAEDALSEAMSAALETWPAAGTPDNPAAWILTVARRKGIDRLRRQRRLAERLALLTDSVANQDPEREMEAIPDDRLGLIHACCHTALSPEGRVALTLRALGGLSTAEIARAFVVSEATMFQRITRAKAKIRIAGIPFRVPAADQLADRTESVLAVIYLIFNAGYSNIAGDDLVRVDLCLEAIRLGEMMCELLPAEPEVLGLTAFCLLTEARRPARLNEGGELVLLADQDRSKWTRTAIERGMDLLTRARGGNAGPYVVQAEIAALHSTAISHADTDWLAVVERYEQLFDLKPSAIVALNYAAAVAMADGVPAGLRLIEPLAAVLANYQPYHAARAELLARADRRSEAAAGFRRALAFPINDVERRHLQRRLADVGGGSPVS